MITIVSGLPRSGTSMMMQMLQAGGMEPLVDDIRKADEDNPKGYYEYEAAKKVTKQIPWLDEAEGKVVKVVYALLYNLPQDREFKVIFMKRKMEEILASQQKMLQRLGREKNDANYEQMGQIFTKHIEKAEAWLSGRDNIDTLYVHYSDAIQNPEENVKKINDFFGDKLNIEKMMSVVDGSLYRQKM